MGGQYRDNMTAAKAASIRGVRMEGRETSNAEKRVAARQAKAEEEARYSLNRLWSLFEEEKRGNRSINGRPRSLYAPHRALLGSKAIPELTLTDIDKLRIRLEKARKSPQTIKHVLTLLKRILRFAERKGYVDALPGKLHITMPTLDNRVTENLTPEQVRQASYRANEEKDQNLASLVRLALFTGMRKVLCSVCNGMTWIFERRFITLRGDTAKKGKTENIPMNEQAHAILQDVMRTNSPYVFPGRYENARAPTFPPCWKRVRQKAGLPATFRPLHGLRHSFASWLASSGQVSMYELQKLLTHSSPQMTQRYAHLHDDALRKASGVAATLFSAASNREDGCPA